VGDSADTSELASETAAIAPTAVPKASEAFDSASPKAPMNCKTCGLQLYEDGACALMCVWTNQEEHPCSFPITMPIRVRFKALITNSNWIRMVKVSE
jgi:hypothetical protein